MRAPEGATRCYELGKRRSFARRGLAASAARFDARRSNANRQDLPQQRRAAVDVDFHPRDVPAQVPREEQADVRHLLRLPLALIDPGLALGEFKFDLDLLRAALLGALVDVGV